MFHLFKTGKGHVLKKINTEMGGGFSVKYTVKSSQAATMVLKPGETTGGPDNKHKKNDQWLYVVSGNGEAVVNNENVSLKKGDLILIEAGDTHEIKNSGKQNLETLNFYSPPVY